MCRDKLKVLPTVVGDEVWEANESSCTESESNEVDSEPDCDSDAPTAASPLRSKPLHVAKELPLAQASIADPIARALRSNVPGYGRAIAAPGRVPTFSSLIEGVNAPPGRVPTLSNLAQGAAEGGLMGLVTHLRGDNTRLREALAAAQHELETLAANQSAQDSPASIDFAHLLSLVKDFGEDPDGPQRICDVEENYAHEDTQIFAICSARGSESPETADEMEGEMVEDEIKQLTIVLEGVRGQVRDLRAELAAKDAEIAMLRCGLESELSDAESA